MNKREFLGEFFGTFLMVLFGCGSVAVTVLFNAHHALFQIAMLWGIGVSLAIYASRHLSCAHFNPAVTLAMITIRRMSPKKLLNYILAQFLGALLAGLTVYLLFAPSIAAFEQTAGFVRGTAESTQTARMFGEFYLVEGAPVPALLHALFAEAFGAFLLVLMIFFLTEGCNLGRPDAKLTPIFIGLTVTSVICLIAPLTQAGLNPARDFGPRLIAWLLGWGKAAFPDQIGGFFFVYILGPILGGQVAALVFSQLIEPSMKVPVKNQCCAKK